MGIEPILDLTDNEVSTQQTHGAWYSDRESNPAFQIESLAN